MTRLNGGRNRQQDQRGAVVIMTAAFMFLAVLCLTLVVDTGRLYVEKRKLQRVADLSAIESSSRNGLCTDTTALTFATQSAARNSYIVDGLHTLATSCGVLTVANGLRTIAAPGVGQVSNAIQVVATNSVPASIIAGGIIGNNITLTATAIATRDAPLAALTLRSTLASIDSSKSALLNTLFSGFLGGSVNVSLLGWQGLVGTQISLFGFLDQLKTTLGISAGGYDQVLATNVSVAQVLDAASTVLTAGGSTNTDAINALSALRVGAMISPVSMQLGSLLGVQTGLPTSGANFTMNLLDLVQGSVQLANKTNTAAATLPITIPGIATATVALKVIQAPILSAIGNPELAKASPLGLNRIYVRAAQIRSLISIDLSALNGLPAITTAVTSVLSPVTSLLNSVFSGGLINNLLCGLLVGTCNSSETAINVLPNARLDVNLDVGAGNAYVTDYNCGSGTTKTLTAPATTSAATLRIGQMGTSAANAQANAFASASPPTVSPATLVEFGYVNARQTCALIVLCGAKTYQQGDGSWSTNRSTAAMTTQLGLGISVNTTLLGTTQTLVFNNPPEVTTPLQLSDYQTISSASLVSSLRSTLSGVTVSVYNSNNAGVLSSLLTGFVTTTLSALTSALQTVIVPLLSNLLDPLINLLLQQLGLDVAQTQVAGQLTCSSASGVSLVY